MPLKSNNEIAFLLLEEKKMNVNIVDIYSVSMEALECGHDKSVLPRIRAIRRTLLTSAHKIANAPSTVGIVPLKKYPSIEKALF